MIRCGYCGRFVRSEMLIVWGTSGEAKLRCHRLACARARDREQAETATAK